MKWSPTQRLAVIPLVAACLASGSFASAQDPAPANQNASGRQATQVQDAKGEQTTQKQQEQSRQDPATEQAKQQPPQEQASAQQDTAQAPPAPLAPLPPGELRKLRALVIGVEGRAQWRPTRKAPWQAAVVGDLLDEGAEVRTGRRSFVALRIGNQESRLRDKATVVLDRTSLLELPVLEQELDVLRSRILLTYGRADIEVDDSDLVNDFRATTPSATLSVRGTDLAVLWGAIRGAEVRGADRNRIRAIELRYFETDETVYLSGGAVSRESERDPALASLTDTVYDPSIDEVFRDLERLYRLEEGGSDFGKPDVSRDDSGNPLSIRKPKVKSR